MVTAPFHFLPDGGSNEGIYARFLAVFRIPEEEGAAILSNVVTVDVHDGDRRSTWIGWPHHRVLPHPGTITLILRSI